MRGNRAEWNGLAYLNSNNPGDWDRMLYKVIGLQPAGWDVPYGKFVAFVKILSNNWDRSVPQLLAELDVYDMGVNDFFKLERNATNKLAALLSDVNEMQKLVFGDDAVDISPFAAKLSNAFMPPVVYSLEEYGLPRMISRKMQDSGIIDFSDHTLSLHNAIEHLRQLTASGIFQRVAGLHPFDRYLIDYFFEGIQRAEI